jgi:hypothetical protein
MSSSRSNDAEFGDWIDEFIAGLVVFVYLSLLALSTTLVPEALSNAFAAVHG